jgi:glutaredoxin
MTHTVVLFVQNGCDACHQEAEFLAEHGVSFTEKNVSDDQSVALELFALGSQLTPTTLIDDDELIIGFDRKRLSKLLDLP